MTETGSTQALRLAALKSFLTARRRSTDRDLYEDLPRSQSGRRKPGLSRDDMALLLNYSANQYTRVEQGVIPNMKRDLADAIATTLKLNNIERNYFFVLAGVTPLDPDESEPTLVTSDELAILEHMGDIPADIINNRFDVLASNDGFKALYPAMTAKPQHEQNLMVTMFTSPNAKQTFVDWEKTASIIVTQFRYSAVKSMANPRYQTLIDDLKKQSPDFRRMWAGHEDLPLGAGDPVTYRFPSVGEFPLTYTKLTIEPKREVSLVILRPEAESPFWTLLSDYRATNPRHWR